MKGELEMTVVFLGLSCEMLLVVASIGADGLLGMEALSRVCHISWIYGWDNCGQRVDRRYSCSNRD